MVEVASNDGYLLQHVVERGIRCLGIEPSVNVGEAARDKGVPTLTAFLTPETGAAVRAEHGPADLVCLNNVYAHIPDVVGFTQGLRALVADDGWVSIEVQHLLTLVERTQFDTDLPRALPVLHAAHRRSGRSPRGGLTLVDVELLATHGGSIRHVGAADRGRRRAVSQRVRDVLAAEEAAGLHDRRGPRRVRRGGVPGARRPGRASSSRRAGRARRWSATAPRARATRCSTTAASGPTCSPTRSTATPTSTAGSPRAPASRSCRPSGSPQTGPTTCWSCPGTCATS